MNGNSTQTLIDRAVEKFGELSFAEKKLFTLAQEIFQELSDSEYKLFRTVANGKLIDYQTKIEAEDKLENEKNWGAERILRGDRLRWLCIEPEVWKLCLPQGIDISGAKIINSLNLSFSEVKIPLRFFQCYFAEALRLEQAKLRQLDLSGTHIASSEITIKHNFLSISTSIHAEGVSITGFLRLNNRFQSKGIIYLFGAFIGRDLECTGETTLAYENEKANWNTNENANENKYALIAVHLNTGGSIHLCQGFNATGTVDLSNATIGGDFACQGVCSGTKMGILC